MNRIVEQALERWDMAGATWTFVAGRENQVFRVEHKTGACALRIKRPGYRRMEELVSELQWLAAMEQVGLHVPRPIPSRNDNLLERVETVHVDMVGWLPGLPLGRSREPLVLADREGTFRAIGAEMAALHAACDLWQPPSGFIRCAWNADGLVGEHPVWDRFWENPTLDSQTRDLFIRFRHEAQNLLSLNAARLDYGLIHADFVRENILIDGDRIGIIDFDDGGFGYRLFDLATLLLKTMTEADFPVLKEALIAGYAGRRALDTGLLELFICLRALTYVGWIMTRMTETGGADRNTRFVNHAAHLCASYLR